MNTVEACGPEYTVWVHNSCYSWVQSTCCFSIWMTGAACCSPAAEHTAQPQQSSSLEYWLWCSLLALARYPASQGGRSRWWLPWLALLYTVLYTRLEILTIPDTRGARWRSRIASPINLVMPIMAQGILGLKEGRMLSKANCHIVICKLKTK